MNHIRVFLSSVQNEFAVERRRIADYIRKPEFHQDDDFRVVLWRPEVQERGKEGGEVRGEVDGKIKKVVLAVRGNTISANEIMKSLQLKGEDNFRKRYLVPSIDNGYIQMLYPDAPKRPDQAYYLTEKGLALYAEISKEN